MRPQNPSRNLFSIADRRGNNPHGTSETSYDEGRRLNAQRYETVGDLDRALDKRARSVGRPRSVVPQLGGVQQPAPTGLLEALVLLAVGAGVAYVLLKRGDEGEGEDEGDGEDVAPQALPAPTTTQNVTVTPAPAPAALPAPVVHVTNPAPVVTITPTPEPAKRRRRRRKPAVPAVAP